MTTTEKIIAAQFAQEIRNIMTEDEMRIILSRNSTDEYQECCATHDFCDANEVMMDAFSICNQFTPADIHSRLADEDEDSLADVELHPDFLYAQHLWNEAWNIAKRNGFDVDKIKALPASDQVWKLEWYTGPQGADVDDLVYHGAYFDSKDAAEHFCKNALPDQIAHLYKMKIVDGKLCNDRTMYEVEDVVLMLVKK